MMTKHTPAITAWFTRLAVIPVIAAAFMLFCGKTEAQQPVAVKSEPAQKAVNTSGAKEVHFSPSMIVSRRPYPSTKEGISAAEMNEYIGYEKKYAARRLSFDKNMNRDEEKHLEQLYQHMSPEQQKDRAISFTYPPDPMGRSYVSRSELNSFKDAALYGVWIDDKRIDNVLLKDFDPKEFCVLLFSRLTPRAVKNDHFQYQINLMTRPYYKKYVENAIANRNNSMIMFHLKS